MVLPNFNPHPLPVNLYGETTLFFSKKFKASLATLFNLTSSHD